MGDPTELTLTAFRALELSTLKPRETLFITESEFPECYVTRRGAKIVCEIVEHIYTKYWWHKFHAVVFAEAMVRAVRRFATEGRPVTSPVLQNDDEPHIFVSWRLILPAGMTAKKVASEIRANWEAVWARANRILEDSDSVLVLGKDTGKALVRLRQIKAVLEAHGYHVYIIKEQADRLGESVIQKVLRHALLSKFVVIENTRPSGHLYEVAHVPKMAECVTAMLQENGRGATWMFEDAYAKSKTWKKFAYSPRNLAHAVTQAANWAEKTFAAFAANQRRVLPWMSKKR